MDTSILRDHRVRHAMGLKVIDALQPGRKLPMRVSHAHADEKLIALSAMLIDAPNDEGCDTSGDDSSNGAGKIIIHNSILQKTSRGTRDERLVNKA